MLNLDGSASPPQDMKVQLKLVTDFLHWVYQDIVIVLLKTFFYITEGDKDVNNLLYFRKTVWNYFIKKYNVLSSTILDKVDKSQVISKF